MASTATENTAPDLVSFIKQRRLNDTKNESASKTGTKATEEKTDEADEPSLNREGAWAAVGFAVVLIVLGIPVWWRTTTVYRAPLPYDSVQELAGVRRQHYLPVAVLAEQFEVGQRFSKALGKELHNLSEIKYRVYSTTLRKDQQEAVEASDSLVNLVSRFIASTPLHSGTLSLLVVDAGAAKRLLNSGESIHVTRENLVVVTENADAVTVAEVVRSMSLDESHRGVAADGSALATRTPQQPAKRFPAAASHKVITDESYSLTITVMLPQPHVTLAHWDSRAAVQAYLSPLLKQFEEVHMRVTVRCQHLYMTPLSGVKPVWDPEHQHYALPHHHLPLAINAIEAKLGSFVSTDAALHFIVYVPSVDQTPLRIHTPQQEPLPSNSFVVPRWGGVMIHNPPNRSEVGPDEDGVTRFPLDEHAIMTTILTQLHTLLPIPVLKARPGVSIAAPTSPELSQWQLDALTRARVTQYYDTTTTTLQSLHELVGEISNMVVSDEVGGWVWQSVEEWVACGEATQEGRLLEASRYCTTAHANAQAAFFHPSMLALLYFPDNQKYAIYVPLFLPVSIPVLLSFKMLFSLAKSYLKKPKRD